jgi:hypothetical protein
LFIDAKCVCFPVCVCVCVCVCFIQENVYNAFRFSGFSIATYNQTVSFLSATTNSSASIPVRVLFYHTNGHAVHLVVFHQRGDDEYLWHGQMTLMNDSQMAAAMSESFGLHAGAYDR